MEAHPTTTSVVFAQQPTTRVDSSASSTALIALSAPDRRLTRDGFDSVPQLPTAAAPDSGTRTSAEPANAAGRKRGRPPRSLLSTPKLVPAPPTPPAAKRTKKDDEDVCFICFDGGTLVLCDRRDCPKAYHPACVKRDEAFFRGRVRWNCGWHLCNSCQRNALFMCYTCTYSLCKRCVHQADIFCVRRNRGFCKTCMSTIMLIENIAQGNKELAQVDFDDKSSWEYLFKVYWLLLKQKESLTLDELIHASNPWKESGLEQNVDSSQKMHGTGMDKASSVGITPRHLESNVPKRRKIQKQYILPHKESQVVETVVERKIPSMNGISDWASKELLEFVAFMRNGDTSELSQFDVEALLLEYVRKNNLRDPHQKCQIICDRRLGNLFRKEQVGEIEMPKLLEYHLKCDQANGTIQAAVMNPVVSQVEVDGGSKVIQPTNKDKKRHFHRKLDVKAGIISLSNHAAIDVHNMNLIYLKRSLIENLLEDSEKFHDKVVGSIVRIRISGSDQKPDMYRLVRVVGTGKTAEPYKSGNKTADFMLRISNLSKVEDVTIDAVSNQEFTEDECRRLRQNMKCGLVARMTVGEIQEKAIALQKLKVEDLLEAEISKLNHLRDRASEMGHQKELRECVEKLELLNKTEERQRRIYEIPEVHADPQMDPTYESDKEAADADIKTENEKMSAKVSCYNAKGVELNSPHGSSETPIITKVKTPRIKSSGREQMRNLSTKPQSVKEAITAGRNERDCESPNTLECADAISRILVELKNGVDRGAAINQHATIASPSLHQVSSDISTAPSLSGMTVAGKELEKIWHYQDPSGKIQGPFCMLQLRKWNSNGYFPIDLRIWRVDQNQNQSILLTDALTQGQCIIGCRIESDPRGTDQRPKEECCSDLNQANTSSNPDEEHTGTQSIDKEKVSLNHPDESPEQKGKVSPEKTSVDSGALHSSSAFLSSLFGELDQKPETEITELPSPTPKIKHEDLKDMAGQNEHGAVSVYDVHNSDSCQGSSSGGLKFFYFPGPTPETDQKDLEHPAENNQSVTDDNHAQDVGTCSSAASCDIEISDIQSLENAAVLITETQASISSNVHGQSSGTSWSSVSIEAHFVDVAAATRDQDNQGVKIDEVVNNQYATSNISCQDSVLSWTTASSLVAGVVPLPDVTGPWSGYPVMHAKSSQEQLDSDLISGSSMRHAEPGCDHSATPESCQLAASQSHADYASRWHGMEPIELSTLGDESVSDLLSEVEAFESLHGRMNMDDSIDSPGNDCFSPLVGLSPPLDPGKHDAMSSTCDIQLHSHSIDADGPHVGFAIDVKDLPNTSGAHAAARSEVEGQLNSTFLSVQQQLFTGAPLPGNLPSLTVGLHPSGISMVEEKVKQVYVSMHQQNLVSGTHSPAPVSPLPPTSQNSSSPVAARDSELDGVSVLQENIVCGAHPLSPMSPLPTMRQSSSSPASEREAKPVDVSILQESLVSDAHTPVQSRPLLAMSLDSSVVTPEAVAKVKSDSTSISMPRQELHPPQSLSPAQPLPTRCLTLRVNSKLEGELMPAYTSLHLHDSASINPSTALPQPPSSVPPSQKLPPPHLSPIQSLLPPMSVEQRLSPVEVGELKPPPHASEPQPTNSVSARLEYIHQSEEGKLRAARDPAHQGELRTPSHHPVLVKVSLPPIDVEQDAIAGEEGELKSVGVPMPHFQLVSPGGRSLHATTGKSSVRKDFSRSETFPARGSSQASSPGNMSMQRSSSSVANQNQFPQQSRCNSSNGARQFGPSRSNSRGSWNRQGSLGRDGGGPWRVHTPRGQRVCKFYESGYCKKGSSCNYLHP